MVTGAFSYTGRHIAEALLARRRGVGTRFERGQTTFARAVQNIGALLAASVRAYTSKVARNFDGAA